MKGKSNNRYRVTAAGFFLALVCLIMGIKASHHHSLKVPVVTDVHSINNFLADQACPVCDFNFGAEAELSIAIPETQFPAFFAPDASYLPGRYSSAGFRLHSTRGPPLACRS